MDRLRQVGCVRRCLEALQQTETGGTLYFAKPDALKGSLGDSLRKVTSDSDIRHRSPTLSIRSGAPDDVPRCPTSVGEDYGKDEVHG